MPFRNQHLGINLIIIGTLCLLVSKTPAVYISPTISAIGGFLILIGLLVSNRFHFKG